MAAGSRSRRSRWRWPRGPRSAANREPDRRVRSRDNHELRRHGFLSDSSDAEIFGLFQTSVLHNLVHLAFGVAGLAMSRRADRARTYLLSAGVIYLVMFVYGLFVGSREDEKWINFIPVNNEDDVQHLLLGLGLLAGPLASRRRKSSERVEPRVEAAPARSTTTSRIGREPGLADQPLARDPTEQPGVANRTDAGRARTTRP